MFHNDSIAGSWRALTQRMDSTQALTCWAVEDDRLTGLHTVERDLLPLVVAGADFVRSDEVLGALVRRAALDGGADPDALLLTVHLLSDWVWPLAVQLRDLGTGMVGVVVSELACQIRTYPWRSRPGAVAASLRWDTRRAILAEFRPSTPRHRYRAEHILAPASDEWEATPLGDALPGPGVDPDIDIVELLQWAARFGVQPRDIALLIRTEQVRADAATRAADCVVAAEFGFSPRTFYRHRDRALRAVRVASLDYLTAVS